jgi:hypothetical protein
MSLQVTEGNSKKPAVYVDPEDNVFYVSATTGETFAISVKAANWTEPGVCGYQLRLYYNNTLLEAIDAAYPPDAWWPRPPGFWPDRPLKPTINHERGYVLSADTLILPEQKPITGGGTIFTITFKIIKTPIEGGNISSSLELRNVKMVDPSGDAIPSENYSVQNGNIVLFGTLRVDLNHDGEVDIQDAVIWGLAFDSHPGDANWNPKVDFNGDEEIDIVDFAQIALAWTA